MSQDFAAGLSTEPDLGKALDEACRKGGIVGADLACVFVSATYGEALDRLPEELQRRLGPRALVGCTVQGAIGPDREVENGPCLAVWTATLGGAVTRTFHATTLPEEDGVRFPGMPEVSAGDTVLLLPDPFSMALVEMFERFGADVSLLGGVASSAQRPGENRLFVDGEVHRDGCAGIVLSGARIVPVVSQGCRPIGRPFVVTRARENVLLTLAGKPAFERLQEVLDELADADRELARRGLHVGCAMDEYKESHRQGDFLIRSVLGVEPSSGALAVGDRFRVGQTVQFQVRDGQSARQELETLLQRARTGGGPAGALVFSCNGRGTHMFGEPHVDARTIAKVLGAVPVAGFFAGGEIGPVGRSNYLHGFTASIAVFQEE